MQTVSKPEDLLRKSENDPDTLEMILNIQLNRVKLSLRHATIQLTDDELIATAETVKEFAGVSLNLNECRDFINLFPEVRANIRIAGIDTETRDLIMTAFCNMLVGCGFKDDDKFLNIVRGQAEKLWPRT